MTDCEILAGLKNCSCRFRIVCELPGPASGTQRAGALTIKPISEGFSDASKRLLRQTELGLAEAAAEVLW